MKKIKQKITKKKLKFITHNSRKIICNFNQ